VTFGKREKILLGVLAAVVVVTGLLETTRRSLRFDPGWENIDFTELEEVALLQQFLQIDTSHETGSEMAGARFLADILEREGIPYEIVDMGGGKANLIARLEGSTTETVVLHNHLDLDPIRSPESWRYPPFSGTIEAPWIYGRGAFDMKSVTIAQLLALVELKRAGVHARRSVAFLATSSEEVDSEDGSLWLLRNRPEIFDDVWVLLTEGGVLEARGIRNIKYWGTEFQQKRYIRVLVCSPSRQRLLDLVSDIHRRGRPLDRLRVTPGVRTFLKSYGDTRDRRRYRELLSAPERLVENQRDFDELPSFLQGLFRDDIHPFEVVENPSGGGYQIRITLSLLEDSEVEEVIEHLLPSWMTAGLSMTVIVEPAARGGSDPDHPFLALLAQVLEERFGEVRSGPYFQGRSATDARFFREAGVPSFGFTPFLALTTDTLAISGPNEGIALPAYIEGVDLYKDLLARLALAPGE